MEGFKERLKDAMERNGMTNYKLSKATGLSASTIANWLNGTTTPDSTKLEVVGLYLGCNADWLLTGDGFMISKGKKLVCETEEEEAIQLRLSIAQNIVDNRIILKDIAIRFKSDETYIKNLIYDFDSKGDIPFLKDILNYTARKEEQTRPRIPYTAAAGSLTSAIEGITEDECEQVPRINIFPDYDFTIVLKGSSMEPKYEGGDEVACKRIDNTSFIQWGRVHVLDTAQGILIKRIYQDGDKIRCVSYNPEYPDFSIDKSEIYSMNLVVGLVRL